MPRLLLLLCLFVLPTPARAAETPAEHAASVYAAQEMAANPVHGNLPDYSLPADKLAKARHLSTIGTTLHFVSIIWGIATLILVLSFGTVGWMRDRAVALTRNRWGQGFTFLFLFLLVANLFSLPLDIYSEHLSRVYGFSVQGWPGWVDDQLKGFGLSLLFGGLLVMLLFWIIRRLPRSWWVVFALVMVPVTVLGSYAVPYISYLFYAHEPLTQSNPALVAQLGKVVAKGHLDIPPGRMYLMKASAKTTELNADVEGFGASKRVVVWDTTVAKASTDEITFIFGHESGHYVLHHIERGLVMGFLGTFIVLYLGFLFVRWSLTRFGPAWRIPSQNDWGALAVLLLAFSLFGALSEPVTAWLSRLQEHAADVYGQEVVHGIVADPQTAAQHGFQVLGETSLADPNPNPFYEFWTYSHPAIGRRAAFAHAYNPWTPGYAPKYFPKDSD